MSRPVTRRWLARCHRHGPLPGGACPPGRLPGDRRQQSHDPTPGPPSYPAISPGPPTRAIHQATRRPDAQTPRRPDAAGGHRTATRRQGPARGPRPLQAAPTACPWRLPRITSLLHTHRPPNGCELAGPVWAVDFVTPSVTAGYPEAVAGTWNDCPASHLATVDATNPTQVIPPLARQVTRRGRREPLPGDHKGFPADVARSDTYDHPAMVDGPPARGNSPTASQPDTPWKPLASGPAPARPRCEMAKSHHVHLPGDLPPEAVDGPAVTRPLPLPLLARASARQMGECLSTNRVHGPMTLSRS